MTATSIADQPDRLRMGETVDLVISGAQIAYDTDHLVTVTLPKLAADPAGKVGQHYLSFPAGHPQVTVTRSVPADGEPRPGDIWLDNGGQRLFAYRARDTASVNLVRADGHSDFWGHWHRGERGPISLDWRPEPAKRPEPEQRVCLMCRTPLVEVSTGDWRDDKGEPDCPHGGFHAPRSEAEVPF